MIQLDNEYEATEAKTGGGYVAPPPGGYVLQVLDVSDKPTKTGKDMITLTLDIAEGEFQGAFEKYPKPYRQLVNGDNLPYFKAMIQAFQESNDYDRLRGLIEHGNCDPFVLKGALVGGCVREAEYRHESGEIKVGLEIGWLCPVEKVPDIKPPKLKKLAGNAGARPGSHVQSSRAPQTDDDLPF